MVSCHYIYTFVCHKPFLSFPPGLPGQSRRQCAVGEFRGHHTQQMQLTLGVGAGISIFIRTSDVQTFQGAEGTSGLSRPSNPADRATDPRGFPALSQLRQGGSGYPLYSPCCAHTLCQSQEATAYSRSDSDPGRALRVSALLCGADRWAKQHVASVWEQDLPDSSEDTGAGSAAL